MEPTGIDPVTSCLQSARDEARRCSVTPVNAGLWPIRRLKADAQHPSKSERFQAAIGRWRPMAMLAVAAKSTHVPARDTCREMSGESTTPDLVELAQRLADGTNARTWTL